MILIHAKKMNKNKNVIIDDLIFSLGLIKMGTFVNALTDLVNLPCYEFFTVSGNMAFFKNSCSDLNEIVALLMFLGNVIEGVGFRELLVKNWGFTKEIKEKDASADNLNTRSKTSNVSISK